MPLLGGGGQAIVQYIVREPVVFGDNPPDEAPTNLLYIFNAAKSNSGNTYNADGTPRPNVIVGDAFKFINLQWIWQFHFGTSQITGLTQVHHDETLVGTGADADNLLKVAKPAAETGAQVNPYHVLKFSGIDGEIVSLNDYKIGFYNGNTQVQSGSITQTDTIYIAENMGTFGAADPTLSTEVPTTRLFEDRVNNGGGAVLAFNKQGTTDFFYVQCETIVAYADAENRPGYKLTNTTWVNDFNFPSGAGTNWNIVAGNTLRLTKDIINLVLEYVKLDGSNINAAFRRAVQEYNEEIDLTGDYTRVSSLSVPAYGQWTINNTPTETSSAQVQINPKVADRAEINLGIVAGTFIHLENDCVLEVTHGSISVANNLWTFQVILVEGSLPAESSAGTIELEGADIHRTEITRPSFKVHTPNTAGKGGHKGQSYNINSDGEIEWEDNIPASLVFSELFDRTSVGAGNYTDGNGQLLFSDGNTAPSDAPNATTFVILNHNDADGNDQESELTAVKAGEWMFVRVGDTFVSARVQYIDKVVNQDGTRFWIIPNETSKHTHAYDTLAAGAAKVGFTNLIPDLNDLVYGNPTQGQVPVWNSTNKRYEAGDN